jgi:hypothetical protein
MRPGVCQSPTEIVKRNLRKSFSFKESIKVKMLRKQNHVEII